jgi:hypothetical protein
MADANANTSAAPKKRRTVEEMRQELDEIVDMIIKNSARVDEVVREIEDAPETLKGLLCDMLPASVVDDLVDSGRLVRLTVKKEGYDREDDEADCVWRCYIQIIETARVYTMKRVPDLSATESHWIQLDGFVWTDYDARSARDPADETERSELWKLLMEECDDDNFDAIASALFRKFMYKTYGCCYSLCVGVSSRAS